jgi:hypothetical protein
MATKSSHESQIRLNIFDRSLVCPPDLSNLVGDGTIRSESDQIRSNFLQYFCTSLLQGKFLS